MIFFIASWLSWRLGQLKYLDLWLSLQLMHCQFGFGLQWSWTSLANEALTIWMGPRAVSANDHLFSVVVMGVPKTSGIRSTATLCGCTALIPVVCCPFHVCELVILCVLYFELLLCKKISCYQICYKRWPRWVDERLPASFQNFSQNSVNHGQVYKELSESWLLVWPLLHWKWKSSSRRKRRETVLLALGNTNEWCRYPKNTHTYFQ